MKYTVRSQRINTSALTPRQAAERFFRGKKGARSLAFEYKMPERDIDELIREGIEGLIERRAVEIARVRTRQLRLNRS